MLNRVAVSAVWLILAVSAFAQDPGVMPAFSTLEPHEYDSINIATLAIQLNAPLRSKAGHIPLSYHLLGAVQTTRYSVGSVGYFQITPALSGEETHLSGVHVSYGHQSALVSCGGSQHASRSQWSYSDQNSGTHSLPSTILLWDSTVCGATSYSGYTTDGSGIFVSFSYDMSGYAIDGNGNKVTLRAHPDSFSDPNGNALSGTQSNTAPYPYSITDTLGQLAITSTVGTNQSQTFTWTDAAGKTQYLYYYTTQLTAYTWFGCNWNNPSPATYNFPSQVLFPDQSTLNYTWEAVYNNSSQYTGRLASLKMPTGGKILYAYSGGTNGVNCVDGTTATMTRTTPDGQWKYTHVPANGATFAGPGTTTVSDPQGNNTVYTFGGLTFPANSGLSGIAIETEKQVYNGAVSSANLVQTVITCYNNPTSTPTNCQGTLTLPVTEKDVYTTYAGVTGYSAVKTAYDTYGRITDVKMFDFNASTATSEKQIVYGTGNPTSQTCSAVGTYIINKPCSITSLDSQNNNAILSQTWNSYDSNGNLLQTWNLASGSGSSGTYLSKQYSYDTHGVVQTMTDVNGQVVNYTTTSCNNMFVSSQYPTGFQNLQTSQTWDCNGGVVIASADENGQVTHTDFYSGTTADPFYRPLDRRDELGYATNFTYTANSTESTFSFNGGNSVIHTVSTTDSIGRPVTAQVSQGPASPSWDAGSRTFDSVGRLYQRSLACTSNTKGAGCSPSTESQTYDALNRPRVHTGTGGDVVTKTYYANDVLTTLTPAPTNENAKAVQKEYDGLGRLKSTCLISSAPGSGPCGQANGGTGFLTTYSYDGAGRLLRIVENAQVASPQQTRTYTYDKLGRLLTETNPEWTSGSTPQTASYIYDNDNNGVCANVPLGMSPYSVGDLIAKVDPIGNATCYFYDGLHRVVGMTDSGQNSNFMGNFFVYDAATVNGIAMSNAQGRLAEAYTCAGYILPCQTVMTDEGYSYDARGLLSDYYQFSPNSKGYYHLSATHWEDKQVKAVTGVGLPTITFGAADGSGLDGEGRVTKVTASTGTNLVGGVTYNSGSFTTEPIGALLNVTLGTLDTQNFTYDKNTGRMTSYSASVGATPTVISGTLSWNANGTLQQLSISDAYNSGDTQVCSYLYDDFVRVAGTTSIPGVNCLNGSTKVWNQTFTYGSDSFGNITKSSTGPGASWACAACYSAATNHYNNVLSATISYDNDGNLLNDTFHTYTWLPDGHVASIDSNTITYDANRNKVEEKVGGATHEYVSAFGITAQMTGQTENATTVDLPGGVQALYSGGTLQRFRYPDWQGSIRAESNPATRAFTESLAFAPFGERYAQKGTAFNKDSFTGKPDQIVSDEYDFPAREEHGGQGRWTSPDPMRGTGNKYVYADNNPLSKVDPYGLLAVVSDGIEMGSYAELAGMGVNPLLLAPESQPSETAQKGAQATTNNTSDTAASGTSTTQTAHTQQAEQTAQQQRNGQEAKQAQNTCQSGNCNVKVIGDTGKDNGGAGTPNPFVAGTNQREITYQAVDQKGHAVSGAEISLHETPLTGKEGGDAKNYSYASGKGSSNSEKGDEGAHRAGQFNDLLTTGGKGPAGFRQTFTVEGKSANIIWPTGHGDVVAPSQKVLDTPSRIIIIPEVNQ